MTISTEHPEPLRIPSQILDPYNRAQWNVKLLQETEDVPITPSFNSTPTGEEPKQIAEQQSSLVYNGRASKVIRILPDEFSARKPETTNDAEQQSSTSSKSSSMANPPLSPATDDFPEQTDECPSWRTNQAQRMTCQSA